MIQKKVSSPRVFSSFHATIPLGFTRIAYKPQGFFPDRPRVALCRFTLSALPSPSPSLSHPNSYTLPNPIQIQLIPILSLSISISTYIYLLPEYSASYLIRVSHWSLCSSDLPFFWNSDLSLALSFSGFCDHDRSGLNRALISSSSFRITWALLSRLSYQFFLGLFQIFKFGDSNDGSER